MLMACAWPAVAQVQDPQVAPLSQLPRPVANAVRIEEALVIDGRLDEGMWQIGVAARLTSCRRSRSKGSPLSERTEVRILYDDEAIYVGVDSARHAIRRSS